jgi:hypothetical protein
MAADAPFVVAPLSNKAIKKDDKDTTVEKGDADEIKLDELVRFKIQISKF